MSLDQASLNSFLCIPYSVHRAMKWYLNAPQTKSLAHLRNSLIQQAMTLAHVASFPKEFFHLAQRNRDAEHYAHTKHPISEFIPFHCYDTANTSALSEPDRETYNAFMATRRDALSSPIFHHPAIEPNLHLNDIVSQASSGMKTALAAFMQAEILLCWTTFESVAGDLWEAAVNLSPSILAQHWIVKDPSLAGHSDLGTKLRAEKKGLFRQV